MHGVVPSTASDRIALKARALNAGVATITSNSPARDFPWSDIIDLRRGPNAGPLASLQDIDFASLATLFTHLNYYSDLEQFLNLLADPVARMATGETAFVFCPIGIGHIRDNITRDINGMLVARILLDTDDELAMLQAESRRIMNHATLLSEVVHLTRTIEGGIGAIPSQNRFVAISDSDRPITLAKGTSFSTGGFTITSQMSTMLENRTLNLTENVISIHTFEKEVQLSPLFGNDEATTNRITNAIEDHFVLMYEFDMTGHVISTIARNITDLATGLVFKGLDTVTSAAKTIFKDIVGLPGSVSSAQAASIRMQDQFRETGDAARLASYLRIFGMDAIVVSRVGQGVQVHVWATPDTPASIAALNEVTNSTNAVASTNYTFTGVLNDPRGMFGTFREISTAFDGDKKIGNLDDIATTNQNLHPANFIPELADLLNQQQGVQTQNQQQSNSAIHHSNSGQAHPVP